MSPIRFRAIPLPVLAVAILAASAVVAQPAPATGVAVKIADFTFAPATVETRVGTAVTWINEDDTPHTVAAVDGSFRSRPLDTGDQYSFTFAKPGVYSYFCSIHPMMIGKVVVRPG